MSSVVGKAGEDLSAAVALNALEILRMNFEFVQRLITTELRDLKRSLEENGSKLISRAYAYLDEIETVATYKEKWMKLTEAVKDNTATNKERDAAFQLYLDKTLEVVKMHYYPFLSETHSEQMD